MPFSLDSYPVLLFDSECPLCVRFKVSLEKSLNDEFSICFIDLHDQSIYSENSFLKYEHCKETLHLLLSPEVILTGDQVLKYLFTNFPQTKKFSWLIENSAGDKAIDLFYKTLNKARRKVMSNCHGCGR